MSIHYNPNTGKAPHFSEQKKTNCSYLNNFSPPFSLRQRILTGQRAPEPKSIKHISLGVPVSFTEFSKKILPKIKGEDKINHNWL